MRSAFLRNLPRPARDAAGRRWLYLPYDQLSDQVGLLARAAPAELGIVLVESTWKAARRPYHRQKLALVLANQRHFALEQARRGVAVRYVTTDQPYHAALSPLIEELGALTVMEPAERELRADLRSLTERGGLQLVENESWLSSEDQFARSAPQGPPWRMDAFYRLVRRETGLLMRDGKPEGGKFSFDTENRKPWRGEPPPPSPPRFTPDEITREVGALINERFSGHPGHLDLESLPATRKDAEKMWRWARSRCLPFFGPYEDAMSVSSRGLFHTRLSPLLNLGRLQPRRVVEEAASMDAPLPSREGFVRQILGWREFVRHVHRATDGFRRLPGGGSERAGRNRERGATPSHLGADRPLPPAFWGERSGLACLDQVVGDVWQEAYSHHITRLMVLSNLATLLAVEPRELADWFWVAYLDAFDWVVEPNVLAMGTFAVGPLMTTKPYVSGAAYIDRMSDYCATCGFDPKKTCPITRLYWAFLDRNEETLAGNPRMGLPLKSLAKRAPDKRREDRRVFERVGELLARGEVLDPEALAG